jgi:hypothetical protein
MPDAVDSSSVIASAEQEQDSDEQPNDQTSAANKTELH